MFRRIEIRLVGLLVACLTCVSAIAQQEVSLNGDWKFQLTSTLSAFKTNFDDSSWTMVTVPHTWNALDGQDGGTYKRGAGWYRRKVYIPAEVQGKVAYLDIAAANMHTKVYVNGKIVGTHMGGYAHFSFDITSRITPGDSALIAVRVDNASTLDAPPLSADFTFFGGITRDMKLVFKNPVHINPIATVKTAYLTAETNVTSPGVRIYQYDVSKTSANVDVRTQLKNASESDAETIVDVAIQDKEGKTVVSGQSKVNIPVGDTVSVVTPLVVENPTLWNGKKNPYLYKVVVTVSEGEKTLEQNVQPLGLRFFSVDRDKGFFLNGESYPLRGIAIHDEVKDKGRAVSDEDRKRDLDIMLETGANFLRLSHYQHGDFTYNYLDSLGIVCWTEIPLIDKINSGTTFANNAASQLYELMWQLYNHPSVIFWGVCNEIRNHRSENSDDIAPLIKRMANIVKAEDKERFSTLAANYQGTENAYTDVYSWNKYWGWYSGTLANISQIDGHRDYTSTPVGVSEYGAGANTAHHEIYPGSQPSTTGQWHPEEYQACYHEKHLDAFRTRPWLWQTSVWVGFDFASDSRDEGDQPGVNDKGLVTHDRLIRKDSYYLYKANWNTTDPFVHITSRRYNPLPTSVFTIRVYSNCERVRLFVNGTALEESEGENHIFTWDKQKLNDGKWNTVIAEGTFSNGIVVCDTVEWQVDDLNPGGSEIDEESEKSALFETGKYYRLQNARYSNRYLAINYTTNQLQAVTRNNSDASQIWTFEPADQNAKYLMTSQGVYTGAVGPAQSQPVKLTDKSAARSVYVLDGTKDGVIYNSGEEDKKTLQKYAFNVENNTVGANGSTTKGAIHNAGDNTTIVGWSNSALNSYWCLLPATKLVRKTDVPGHAVFKYPFSVRLPEGAEAFVAESVNKESVTLKSIGSVVPAETPVLVTTKEDLLYLTILEDKGKARESVFAGSYYPTKIGASDFVVVNLGLFTNFQAYDDYATSSLSANSAWLPTVEGSNSVINFDISTRVTALNQLSETHFYDLQGRCVQRLTKGLYISDKGDKVILK